MFKWNGHILLLVKLLDEIIQAVVRRESSFSLLEYTAKEYYHRCLFSYVLFIPFFVFSFWSLLAKKLRKYYLIFVDIFFARQDGKKPNENYTAKVTKVLKTKRRKYGKNETNNNVWKKCFILKLLARDFYSFHYPPRFYMIKDGYVSKVFFSPQLWLSYSGLLFLHIIWNFTLLMSSANFSVMRDDVQTSMHFSFFPLLSLSLSHPSQFPV